MIKIDRQLCDATIEKAIHSSRKRRNYNFHQDDSAIIQRMLNAIEPGTYVRPHQHVNPDKNEVFIILLGKALVIEFNDDGSINQSYVLDNQQGNYGVELAPGRYHTIISLRSGTVVYELKEGPYLPATVKHFANWAPEEGNSNAQTYLENLTKQCTTI